MVLRIKYFNRYSFIISYFIGVLTPYLYLIFFKNLNLFLKRRVYQNKIFQFFFIFFILQLLSTFLSIFGKYNIDYIRYIAITHNYANYFLFMLGMIWLYDNTQRRKEFFYSIQVLYYIISFISIVSFIYSFYTLNMIHYEGLLSKLTGVSNNYTQVNINSRGFLENSIFPRTRLFATYSNTSAIVMYIVFSIYLIEFRHSKLIINIIFIIFATIAIFTTASRIVLITFIFWSYLYLLQDRQKLLITLSVITLISLLYYNEIIAIFSYINNTRSDSSNTRLHLYKESLELMTQTNILFGLGLKPRLDVIKDLPIGSHSTLIGYFVKNGLIGGSYILIGYIFLSIYTFKTLLLKKYAKNKMYVFSLFFLSIIFIFEDMDSYEFVAFLTGILIYLSFFNKGNNA